MLLIGLSGKARSGKDTFCRFLIEAFDNRKCYRVAFADKLKYQAGNAFGLTYDQLYGDLKEVADTRYPKIDGCGYYTPREILQDYGQFMRTIAPNYWIDSLFSSFTYDTDDIVIISDVRHINEIETVKLNKGYNFKLHREGAQSAQNAGHISENALNDYDDCINIDNNGTLDELRSKAIKAASLIKSGNL